jgi:hypothetical protein
MSWSRSFPLAFLRPRARSAAAVLVLASCAVAGSPSAPPAFAGEPDAPPPVAAPTPRLSALEQEIRHLEKSLQSMRKARTELTAGRPEPVPVDAPARAASDARRAALREVARYEAARAKALAAHADALTVKDDTKVAAARNALEAADVAFVAALAKIDAKAQAATEKADAGSDDAQKSAPKPEARPNTPPDSGEARPPARRGARRGSGDGSSMGSGDDLDDADDLDADED